VIVLARAFMTAGRSGSVGNRKLEVRNFRKQARDQRGLPRPGWRRDDENSGQRTTPG
jgi:hypothetical protein